MSQAGSPLANLAWARYLGILTTITGLAGVLCYPMLVLTIAFTGTPGSEIVMIVAVVGGAAGFGALVVLVSCVSFALGGWRLVWTWIGTLFGLVMFVEGAVVLGLAELARGLAWH